MNGWLYSGRGLLGPRALSWTLCSGSTWWGGPAPGADPHYFWCTACRAISVDDGPSRAPPPPAAARKVVPPVAARKVIALGPAAAARLGRAAEKQEEEEEEEPKGLFGLFGTRYCWLLHTCVGMVWTGCGMKGVGRSENVYAFDGPASTCVPPLYRRSTKPATPAPTPVVAAKKPAPAPVPVRKPAPAPVPVRKPISRADEESSDEEDEEPKGLFGGLFGTRYVPLQIYRTT